MSCVLMNTFYANQQYFNKCWLRDSIETSCTRRIGGYDVILVSSSYSTHLGRPGIQSVTMQMPSPTKRSLASDAIIPSFVIPSNG